MNNLLPNHVAIIPDGNRRWAKEKGLPTIEGHRRGFNAAVNIAKKIRSMGVSTLTLWAFSTENWNRTADEIGYLMKLFEILFDKNLKSAIADRTKITHIGRKDRLSETLLAKIKKAENETKQFDKHFLNIALDYGGRDEVIRAVKKITSDIVAKKLALDTLNEVKFQEYLDTGGLLHPDPDLVIRTSGEVRTSGFMMWQSAYSEFVFLEKYFPDITDDDIEDILGQFTIRQRRFGK